MFNRERANRQLEFIIEIDKMKNILRRNIVIDKSHRENDAEHSWHIAVMAMLLEEYAVETIDITHVLKMLLVHDLVEVYAGDTFCYDKAGNRSKRKRESAAADKLFSILPNDQNSEIRALWEEFDKAETKDALYAASVDRLEPFLLNVSTDGYTWKQGDVTKNMVLKRVEHVKRAMPELYICILEMLDACVLGGILKDG
ncbi:MAG: HD domain-containing protein [Clostridia bacterium]